MKKDYRELEIFKEFSDLSKELRESIQQMKRYYRFDVGDEIRRLLREISTKLGNILSILTNLKRI